MAGADQSSLPITNGTIERIRQLLKPDLARAARGSSKVYRNGVLLSDPIIASGEETIVSTGVYGPYSVVFAPVTFAAPPLVTAWCSIDSGGHFVHLSWTNITATGFDFSMEAFSPGQVVVAAASAVFVEWMAIGS